MRTEHDPGDEHDGIADDPARPCTKRTWCTLERDHDGSCEEKPRAPIAPTDFGPQYRRSR